MIKFIINQLHNNPFFFTAVIASISGALIVYSKDFFKSLYDILKRKLIFSACIYQSDPLFSDFEVWFYDHYGEKYKNVEASSINTLSINNDQPRSESEQRTDKDKQKVYFKQSEGIFFIKYQGKYILIKKGKEKMDHASDIKSFFFNQYHFYAIKGATQVKSLLEEALNYAAKKAKNQELKIYSNGGYGDWYIGSKITSKKLESVILQKEKKQELIEDLKQFLTSKDEYNRRSIFWKRGYLFSSDPGMGKTSLALAIASYLERDVYSLDLNSILENNYLKSAFSNMQNNSVLLIEDFDGFFIGRKAVKKDSKISFSTLLNCIDGAFYKEGIITIITTNILSSIDPALLRSGRMDFKFEIPKPGINEINEYLKIFYDNDQEIERYSGKYSMSDIQEICLSNNQEQTILKLNQ